MKTVGQGLWLIAEREGTLVAPQDDFWTVWFRDGALLTEGWDFDGRVIRRTDVKSTIKVPASFPLAIWREPTRIPSLAAHIALELWESERGLTWLDHWNWNFGVRRTTPEEISRFSARPGEFVPRPYPEPGAKRVPEPRRTASPRGRPAQVDPRDRVHEIAAAIRYENRENEAFSDFFSRLVARSIAPRGVLNPETLHDERFDGAARRIYAVETNPRLYGNLPGIKLQLERIRLQIHRREDAPH